LQLSMSNFQKLTTLAHGDTANQNAAINGLQQNVEAARNTLTQLFEDVQKNTTTESPNYDMISVGLAIFWYMLYIPYAWALGVFFDVVPAIFLWARTALARTDNEAEQLYEKSLQTAADEAEEHLALAKTGGQSGANVLSMHTDVRERSPQTANQQSGGGS